MSLSLSYNKTILEDGRHSVNFSVVDNVTTPPQVFLKRAEDDTYSAVASLAEMLDFPVTKTAGKMFYREASGSLTRDTAVELKEAINTIKANMLELDNDYERFVEDDNYDEDVIIVID
jgi:hypothetical protein